MLRSETKTPNSDMILKLRFAAELLKTLRGEPNSTLVCGTNFASLQSSYSSAAKVFAAFFTLSTRERAADRVSMLRFAAELKSSAEKRNSTIVCGTKRSYRGPSVFISLRRCIQLRSEVPR